MKENLYLIIGIPFLTIILNAIREFLMSNYSSKKQKELYIHQKNFEKRFDLSQKLWDLLTENMRHTIQLRPRMDYVDRTKSKDEVKEERLRLWNNSHNDLKTSFLSGKPYYSASLKTLIEKFIEKSNEEATEYCFTKLEADNCKEYFNQSEENSKVLESILDEIKSEISNQNRI